MAGVIISGDTSGSVTLQAPATAGTVTVTLPSASGTMAVSGASPSFTTITTTSDASISGLTVGKGGGASATNTALGASVLNANSSGIQNAGVGAFTLQNSTSSNNAGLGYGALAAQTSGGNNTAMGYLSAQSTTTGASNVAIGSQALNSNTTASQNTAVGYQAGYSFASTGTAPVTAFGYQAAYTINAADPRITAIGYQALYTNNGGGFYENTAVGYSAAKLTTTGSSLVAVGNECLAANTTGSKNVAIGYQALVANTATSNCTAIGYQAGSGLSGSAGGFTSIGYQSGNNFTNGFNSTFVGNGAQAGAPTGNNEIVICTSGQTGKGTSTGFIAPSTGGVYQGNNSSSWSTTSDQRLKKNIVDNTEGLDKIVQIRVRNFEYRTVGEVTELPAHTVIDKQGVQLGVIAQELREVCPDCVKEESTGVISVDSDNIFWHMVNAIKDLKAELDTVKAELAALKG